MLGDLIIAEPKALIGFAGPRVIEQTIRQKLPKDFQRSEFLLDHGMIDAILDRREMRPFLIKSLDFMMNPDLGDKSHSSTLKFQVATAAASAIDFSLCEFSDCLANDHRLKSVPRCFSTKRSNISSVSATRRLSIKLGLANTETLLERLSEIRTSDFRKVQIAGTNGKGSTAVFLDPICRHAGIRTGLFTSPHLISITERIKIEGEQISEDEFARHTTTVSETATRLVKQGDLQTLPTFFEHVTAIALLAFAKPESNWLSWKRVWEDRLDSTTAAEGRGCRHHAHRDGS